MNLLLDTHTFIWWRDDPGKLSMRAFEAISSPDNEIFLSIVSAWELQIKIALNKLELKISLEKSIESERLANGFQILPVSLQHVLYLENLPPHHNDPFDRLLISQAIIENMFVVTRDSKFANYDTDVMW